ncbi:hypothetical protein OCH239_21595 [Roseivivax halodurans JCM 10272]|uniref:Uncharacterized protein n=1 Tax=Roseivivax halodurans JCM 10272 TaxID=1449350 RepID=X7EHN4_9RHOB|nr:hypothetical protein [Roseivivax halodurans]ETX14716.1 hypothetical protein OCH239_21595 [Roseivivax halodurans JCM 10272]
MRAHAPRNFTLAKAALLAALIGLGHFLAHKGEAEEIASACVAMPVCEKPLHEV